MLNFTFNYGPALGTYLLPHEQGSTHVPAQGTTTTQYVIQVPQPYNWVSDRARFLNWLSPIPLKKFSPPAVTWRVVEEDQRQVELAVTLSPALLKRDRKWRESNFLNKLFRRNPLERAISKSLKAYQEEKTRVAIVEKRAFSRAGELEKRQMKSAKELSLASPHVQTEIRRLLNLKTAQPKEVSDLRSVLERVLKPEYKEQLARERERKADLERQLAREQERNTDLEEQLAREGARKTDLEEQLAKIRLEADLAFHRPPLSKNA